MEQINHEREHTSENMLSSGSHEVSISDLWLAVCRQKTLFGAIFTIGTLTSLAIAMVIPRYYTASVVVMPPAQNTSASSAVLAQLGALANMPSLGGSKTGDEFYLAMLRTRRLQAPLVKKLNLQSRYSTESMTETYAKLSERVSISSDKKAGLLYIEASDRDANFAADLANAHARALSEVLDQIAVTEAQQRRMFFEQELKKARDTLHQAELNFRALQRKENMLPSQAIAESGIRSIVQLQEQIASREIALASLASNYTEQHSEIRRLRSEIGAIKAQLSKHTTEDQYRDTSENGIETTDAFRKIKISEATVEALTKHYELARLEEAKEGPVLQVIDVATPPERPSKPKRSLVVAGGSVASLLLAVAVAIYRGRRRSQLA